MKTYENEISEERMTSDPEEYTRLSAGISVQGQTGELREVPAVRLLTKLFSSPPAALLPLFHPVAGGTHTLYAPYAAALSEMPFFLFVYCDEGALQWEQADAPGTVSAGEAAVFSCAAPLSFRTTVIPFAFRFVFCGGRIEDAFRSLMASAAPLHPAAERFSPLTLDRLLSFPSTLTPALSFRLHAAITALLCRFGEALSLPAEAEESDTIVPQQTPEKIPGYLSRMHRMITGESEQPLSLPLFEELFGISRYRLCREYREVFGQSPIRHLTSVRLSHAKTLLLNSPMHVQEISGSVGFNDVTHFIRLFKKETGMTPGEYRKAAETAEP